MANNIFYEAGHESTTGQAAVAHVVLNRVRHGFGADPCKVIHQVTKIEDRKICQFSWVCNPPAPVKYVSDRWQESVDIAMEVMYQGITLDHAFMEQALYFHNTHVRPRWGLERLGRIGGHIFYSDDPAPQRRSKNG